jgi:hypothetical protein
MPLSFHLHKDQGIAMQIYRIYSDQIRNGCMIHPEFFVILRWLIFKYIYNEDKSSNKRIWPHWQIEPEGGA